MMGWSGGGQRTLCIFLALPGWNLISHFSVNDQVKRGRTRLERGETVARGQGGGGRGGGGPRQRWAPAEGAALSPEAHARR